ncbi:MAG TPA: aspartate kinase [Candidatus Limnocylindrales bacterium]|nr:aspartate kinase [Candidatus Limnocylindrales bacterium]
MSAALEADLEAVTRPVLVQKYGGTSLGTVARIKKAAKRIAEGQRAGFAVVVVVSAMGDTTDRLLTMAGRVAKEPLARELDLLLSTGEGVSAPLMSMALHDLGVPAVSLLGFQAGIRTDRRHARARILDVSPERVARELAQGRVVVVAGFQGVGDEMEVTTLGRGGSDTTAVALAVGLQAQACEILTDVRGIYTADPRLVPNARLIPRIAYAEMLELASVGARVMHPRSVEIAQAYGMALHVRSSFHKDPGTIICAEEAIMEERNRVRGIAHEEHVARLSVVGVPDRPGIAASIFTPLAEADIAADVIVQTASHEGITDISFTVQSGDGKRAEAILGGVAREIGARMVLAQNGLAKVSVVGTGIRGQPGVAATMFQTLADHRINIEMVSTSEIRITCIIKAEQVQAAVRALHEAFHL